MEIIAADHAFCSSNTLHVMDLCRTHFSHIFFLFGCNFENHKASDCHGGNETTSRQFPSLRSYDVTCLLKRMPREVVALIH